MRGDSNAAAIHAAATGQRRTPLARRIRVPAGAVVMQRRIADDGGPSPSGRDAIVAAAQVYNPAQKQLDRKIKRTPVEEWQTEAWALRDEIGELRFIGDRQARACSQVRVFIAKKDDAVGEPKPLEDGPSAAGDLNDSLFGNSAAVEQELKRAAQHLIYAGESIIVAAEQDPGRIGWTARSGSELTGGPGRWKLNDGVNPARDVSDNEIVIRVWNPHPEWLARADAPVRAVLATARELRGLTQFVGAQIDSRLAGAGLLLLPQGIESAFSRSKDDDELPDDYTFADEFADYMMVPIQDRSSAGSVVPMMATVPDELIDKIKLVRFDSPLDGQAKDLRDEAIRRIGLGMDSDPSVLLGAATGNHWQAWQVDDSEVKYGVVPIVSTICHALTVGLVQPLLESAGVPDADQYQVWYDETVLQVRSDRSKDAQALHEKKLLSDTVVRAENGFSDEDAPGKAELKTRVLTDLLQLVPGYAPQILPELGIELPGVTDQPAPAPAEAGPAAAGQTPTDSGGVAPEAADGPPVLGQTDATGPQA